MLTDVSFPSSVTSFGDYVFADCPSLSCNESGNAYYLGNGYNLMLVPHMLGYECGLTAGQFP